MNSYYPKPGEVAQKWHLIDLSGKTLGRITTEIAMILMGKTKPQYTPSVDVGDSIVAINADKIRLTGNKLEGKKYYWHTGAIGGIRSISAGDLLKKDSTQLITHAVKGMLPKNKLGAKMIKKLKVYKGAEHDNAAQKPEPLAI